MTTDELDRLSLDGAETWALEFPGSLTQREIAELREQLEAALPDKRVVIVMSGGHFVPLETLDAAWAEAEAALPEDGWITTTGNKRVGYNVEAWQPWGSVSGQLAKVFHQNPAAALRALAAKLRESVR